VCSARTLSTPRDPDKRACAGLTCQAQVSGRNATTHTQTQAARIDVASTSTHKPELPAPLSQSQGRGPGGGPRVQAFGGICGRGHWIDQKRQRKRTANTGTVQHQYSWLIVFSNPTLLLLLLIYLPPSSSFSLSYFFYSIFSLPFGVPTGDVHCPLLFCQTHTRSR
jgi:hypothetical protein